MRLIGVQFDIVWEDRAGNFAKVRQLLAKSPPMRGDLVVLPEMFASGFSMNLDRTAETEQRETEAFLGEVARQYAVTIVGGQATRGPERRGRNEAVVMSPAGEVIARYEKIHPFSMGKEAEHFTGGDRVVTFKWADATVAPFVCYDLRFPEIFRIAVTRQAQIYVVIANWPAARVEHWRTLLRARAIENQAYVIGVNRCGSDPYLDYPGRSMIVGFRGNIVAEAGEGEEVIAASVDLAALLQYRRELPFLGDMRTHFLNFPGR
jgi:predicted amidohydrolase